MNRISLLVGLGLALTCSNSRAQTKLSPLDQMLRTRPRQVTEWTWVNKPWKGNSAPYLRINRQINAAFANKKRIEAVTQRYRAAAEAKPTDPLAVYAWGYAAYAARPIGASFNAKELPKLALAFAFPPDPGTYQYSRLRCAITIRWRPYAQLKPMGNRVLKRNLNDRDVKLGMINLLVAGSKAEQQQALSYAQQLVKDYPRSATSYSALAWVYDIRFGLYRNPVDGDKAIAIYRQCIALSKYPLGIQMAEENIHRIQQMQKQMQRS